MNCGLLMVMHAWHCIDLASSAGAGLIAGSQLQLWIAASKAVALAETTDGQGSMPGCYCMVFASAHQHGPLAGGNGWHGSVVTDGGRFCVS